MEIVFLPLPPSIRRKLQIAGFRTAADFAEIGPVELAKETSLSHEESLNVLKLIPGHKQHRPTAIDGAKSAWDLLSIEKLRKKVTTMSSDFDGILGGGISPGEVTEICGVPGIGKTQFGMQIAMTVQIPEKSNGLGGHAVYIDTEGSFMVERAIEMANGLIEDVQQHTSTHSQSGSLGNILHWTADDILSRIFYFRVHDYIEQIALVNSMPNFLRKHPLVKLIVIDSVTFHFRQNFSDMALRTRLLAAMSQKLMSMAATNDCAVVVVNQVTTKVTADASQLVPALGESWSHACTNRIILFWSNAMRNAYMYKSPSLKNEVTQFTVSSKGIRNLEQESDGDIKRRKIIDQE